MHPLLQRMLRFSTTAFSLAILCMLRLPAHGQLQFSAPVTFQVGANADYPAAADLDGDGYLDLVVPNGGTSHVALFRNHGDGSFESPVELTTSGSDDRSCVVGDFNNDGEPDIA